MYFIQLIIFCAVVNIGKCIDQPSSCAELLLQGKTDSGIYTIHPRSWYKPIPFKVYCDMDTEGGGWTVFQKRDDYEVHENFFRKWNDYKFGFGKLDEEFWLGTERLYILTNQDHVTLRIDLEDFEENKKKAEYSQFRISNEQNNYKLSVSGYSGDAGDGLAYSNNALFTTTDRNDVHNSSKNYKGGWWYTEGHHSNLNGLYLKRNHLSWADGINWYLWRGHQYSLKVAEMKIRPTNFVLTPIIKLE